MISIYNILRKSWPFLTGLLLGLYFISFNVIGTNFSHFPGDLGDGRFTMYILEHAYQYFSGQVPGFWDSDFMVPETRVITYSENMIGTAPFYALFRICKLDVETSFQAWFLMMTFLNYLFSYLFLKKCFKNTYSAVLGAMIFTFSMALQNQMAHSQTFPRFAIPLAFYMAMRFNENLKPVYFLGALLAWVYQMYCGIYIGFLLLVPLSLFLFITAGIQWPVFKEQFQRIKWSASIAGSLLLSLILLAPLMYPYKIRSEQIPLNSYKDIFENIPSLASHFFSMPGTLLWGSLKNFAIEYPAFWDHEIFAGGVASLCLLSFWVIIIAKLIKPNLIKKVILVSSWKVMFLTSLLTFIFFIRFGHFSLYQYVHQIPGFGSMRAIQRIINLELLYFAFATSFIVSLFLKKENLWTGLIFFMLAGVIILDNYYVKGSSYVTSKELAQARRMALCQKMKNIPAGSLVSYEPSNMETRPIFYQIDAMFAAQLLHLRTVNGYTGAGPLGYSRFWNELSPEGRQEWFNKRNYKPDTVYVIN